MERITPAAPHTAGVCLCLDGHREQPFCGQAASAALAARFPGGHAVLREYLLPYWRRYVTGIFWLFFVDGLQLVTPRLLGKMTDELTAGTLTARGILFYVGLIMGIAVAIAVGRYFWRMAIQGAAREIEYNLRNRLYQHLQRLSSNYFNHHKTGDLMAHATNDIPAVRQALGQGVVMAFDALFLTLVTVALMIRTVNLRLTVVALLPLPFLTLVVTSFGRLIHRRFRRVQEAFATLTDKAQEDLSGIRVLKTFVQEDAELGNFTACNQRYVDANMRLVRASGLFGPLVQFISAISFVVLLGYGGNMVLTGAITLGDFVAFNSYLGLLVWPMMAVGWVINMLQRGSASWDRLQVIFREQPEIVEPANPAPVTSLRGDIRIRHLTFTYPGSSTPALVDINLDVPAGHTLAIVGRTGSGKSTLASLLLRLYEAPPGTIFLDGYELRTWPLGLLRESIGYVPQENFLFSDTVARNVAFAGEGFSRQQIEEAARWAQLYDNIMEFPQGFETLVGERGVTLSGGQKQRAALARALIKNPRLLILDDCLSAVDTQTESLILQRLREIMAERTSIIISHRLLSVTGADEIIVLDGGRIAERGDHASLLRRRGIYYQMWQRQLLEEELASQE